MAGTGHIAPSSLDLAESMAGWLRSGNTQDSSGAHCGWLDHQNRLSAPYPEITGYMLTFLAAESLTGQQEVAAAAAADWLASRVEQDNFAGRPEDASGIVYTFDVAMMAHGLLSFGSRYGDPRLLAAGQKATRFLLDRMDDSQLPTQLPDHVATGRQATWSTVGSAHLLKATQALLRAGELGVSEAAAAADQLVRQFLDTGVDSDVPVRTMSGSEVISLHAACYAAEALWMYGQARGDGRTIARASEIAEWVWSTQLANGGFAAAADQSGQPSSSRRQSDVLTQAVRLAMLLPITPPGLARAVAALRESTWFDDQLGAAAVLYWPEIREPDRNCWSTLFGTQALRLYTHAGSSLDWRELV